ncbi:O-antigen ligase family protein [Leptothrix sp. BB-4]
MFSPFQPFLYLLAYLAVLYVRPHEYLPSFQGVPVLPVLLVGAAVFWLLRQSKDLGAPQFRLLPLQMLLMSLSLLLVGWGGGAVTVLTEFSPVVILFFMLATSLDREAKFKAVFGLLVLASVLMSLHGADQMANAGIGWTGAKTIDERITYLGFLNDPNDLAMSMLMSLPMAMYLGGGGTGFLLRWFWRAMAGVIVYGVFLTNSRGALLALGGILFAYFVWRYGLKRGLMLLPVLGLGLIAAAPGRLANMSADEESAAGRIDAWYEGFQMLRSNPLFGIGKGLFTEHNLLTAHNSFMLALAELGVVGYFVWFSGVLLTLIMLLRVVRHWPVDLPKAEPPVDRTMDVAPASAMLPVDEAAEAATAAVHARRQVWQETQRLARALLYSYVAVLVCCFFLSRTYVVVVYVEMALIVAVYQLARHREPDLSPVRFGDLWQRLLAATLASILLLYTATRLLM